MPSDPWSTRGRPGLFPSRGRTHQSAFSRKAARVSWARNQSAYFFEISSAAVQVAGYDGFGWLAVDLPAGDGETQGEGCGTP